MLKNTRKVIDEKGDYRKPKGKRCFLNLNPFRSKVKGKYSTGKKIQSLAVVKSPNLKIEEKDNPMSIDITSKSLFFNQLSDTS